MITAKDIFVVQVSEMMVSEGINYAEKSLHYTYNRMGLSNHYDRLRNIVKGLIMEQALKELLTIHNVHFDLLGNTHWMKKDRYDVGINGKRYDVKGNYISNQKDAHRVKLDPSWLLDCCALVPKDQVEAKSLAADDYYVFAYMIGSFVRDTSKIYDMFNREAKRYLIHTFLDNAWYKNENWKSIGKLQIESKMETPIAIRIGGQDENGEVTEEIMKIAPGGQYVTKKDFFTVLFAQTSSLPSGGLTVKNSTIGKTEEIGLLDWGNLWVQDSFVYLPGFISKGKFRDVSVDIPMYYKNCKQYSETRTPNRMINVEDLDSLRELLPEDYSLTISAQ